ncbi:hypothetical protein E24_00498 [Faustovirus]|nr:hypothetical protein PRJ_Fausto_00467 [Faustovirus]AMN83411.1 hypothetical protein E24_00498 [Faustovirus]AMN84393.1 hypothetical protein D5a_00496 [Faustovirus]AMN85381.1 hypothetical protein E23_00498 [Faustovirus]QBR99372.1 hypothetical protein [Faustovirus mariensis]
MSDSVYLAIDIEKLGDYQNAHIIAVGFCLGNAHGDVLETKMWAVSPGERDHIEPRCKSEFWDRFPQLLADFIALGRPACVVYSEIAAWLDGLEAKYPNITILSDNPSYDLGGFDNLMYRFTGRLPLRYSRAHVYRCVTDYSEQLWALGPGVGKRVCELAAARMNLTEDNKHNPAKDAEFIYHASWLTSKLIDQISTQVATMALEAINKTNFG